MWAGSGGGAGTCTALQRDTATQSQRVKNNVCDATPLPMSLRCFITFAVRFALPLPLCVCVCVSVCMCVYKLYTKLMRCAAAGELSTVAAAGSR